MVKTINENKYGKQQPTTTTELQASIYKSFGLKLLDTSDPNQEKLWFGLLEFIKFCFHFRYTNNTYNSFFISEIALVSSTWSILAIKDVITSSVVNGVVGQRGLFSRMSPFSIDNIKSLLKTKDIQILVNRLQYIISLSNHFDAQQTFSISLNLSNNSTENHLQTPKQIRKGE